MATDVLVTACSIAMALHPPAATQLQPDGSGQGQVGGGLTAPAPPQAPLQASTMAAVRLLAGGRGMLPARSGDLVGILQGLVAGQVGGGAGGSWGECVAHVAALCSRLQGEEAAVSWEEGGGGGEGALPHIHNPIPLPKTLPTYLPAHPLVHPTTLLPATHPPNYPLSCPPTHQTTYLPATHPPNYPLSHPPPHPTNYLPADLPTYLPACPPPSLPSVLCGLPLSPNT